MRSDLDRLMQERGLAGLVVFAHDRYCPAFYYATGQRIHHGIWLRSADGRAHLVVDPMERDQAAASGIEWSTYAQHGFLAMVKSSESQTQANATLIAKLLDDLGITGRVAFAGEASLGYAHAMLEHLRTVSFDDARAHMLAFYARYLSILDVAVPTIAAIAGPGTALVSNTVRDLVAGSGLRFEDRGRHALKGLPEELQLYAALGGAA